MISGLAVCTDIPSPGRVVDAKLAALRAQYPFVAIQPTPTNVLAVFLAAGVERTVQLPDRTQMVRFTASGSPFYAQLQGLAQIPAAGNDIVGPGVLVNPEGWYYVAELRQVSLIAPADTIVSLHCHVQQ